MCHVQTQPTSLFLGGLFPLGKLSVDKEKSLLSLLPKVYL